MQLLILLVSLFSIVLSVNEKKCNGTRFCANKCCEVNYNLNDTKCVYQNYTVLKVPVIVNSDVANVNFENIDFAFPKLGCFDDMQYICVKLQPDVTPDHAFFVESSGSLWVPVANRSIDYELYCLDFYNGKISALVCNSLGPRKLGSAEWDTIGYPISLPFLFVTFVVYALLPERNLHGKCLMSFVFATFWAYFAIVFLKYNPLDISVCILGARIMVYCFFYAVWASFFWMNAMCFDICSTFSGVRGFTRNRKQTERRRFLIYSVYAWGMPLLLVNLIAILSKVFSSNEWYDPGVRGAEIWVKDGVPTYIYSYGALVLLVIANMVMFIKTFWRIKKTRDKTAVLVEKESKKHSDDKQTFNLYLKLFFGMGFNMSLFIIADILKAMEVNIPSAVKYLIQFSYAGYGVFIFFIFVFKRSIWMQLKKRLCSRINKISKQTSSSRQRTNVEGSTETNVTELVTTESS